MDFAAKTAKTAKKNQEDFVCNDEELMSLIWARYELKKTRA